MNTVKNKGILIGLIIFAVFLTTFWLIFLKDKKEPVETPSTTLTVEQAGTINIGDQYKKIIINVEDIEIEETKADSLSLQNNERELIVKALEKHKGRRNKAAEELGISQRTLYRKIKQYNLED